MSYRFPEELLKLIQYLKKWPGVGTRTAERFAFELLSWDNSELSSLSALLATLKMAVPPCPTCGCLSDHGVCSFCLNRSTNSLCILASARDAYAIEATGRYKGLYHVIEHLLSPLDGRTPEQLRLDRIQKRLEEHPIQEIILAFDSTLEGDTTALYLKTHLARPNLKISRLAFGLPLGSPIEHIDPATLSLSFESRQ